MRVPSTGVLGNAPTAGVATSGQVAPPARPWSPLDLDPALWLDGTRGMFADLAMTTPAAMGDPVAVWADQSGHGRHATQSVVSKRPQRSVGGLEFDGVDDLMDCANCVVGTGFVVVTFNQHKYYNGLLSGQSAGFWLLGNGNQVWDGSPLIDVNQVRRNGVTTKSLAAVGERALYDFTDNVPNNSGDTGIRLGYERANAGRVLNGRISDVLLFPQVLPVVEIQQLRAYFAAKHNIALP